MSHRLSSSGLSIWTSNSWAICMSGFNMTSPDISASMRLSASKRQMWCLLPPVLKISSFSSGRDLNESGPVVDQCVRNARLKLLAKAVGFRLGGCQKKQPSNCPNALTTTCCSAWSVTTCKSWPPASNCRLAKTFSAKVTAQWDSDPDSFAGPMPTSWSFI